MYIILYTHTYTYIWYARIICWARWTRPRREHAPGGPICCGYNERSYLSYIYFIYVYIILYACVCVCDAYRKKTATSTETMTTNEKYYHTRGARRRTWLRQKNRSIFLLLLLLIRVFSVRTRQPPASLKGQIINFKTTV